MMLIQDPNLKQPLEELSIHLDELQTAATNPSIHHSDKFIDCYELLWVTCLPGWENIQSHFHDSKDSRQLWQGLKSLTEYRPTSIQRDSNVDYLNHLNHLNTYFVQSVVINNTLPVKALCRDNQVLILEPADVHKVLRRANL